MWRPRLAIRYGKGGSTPSSPTSSAGYVLLGSIGAALAAACVAAALSGKLVFLVALLIPGIALRDAWAWFAATKQEREAFRAEVARHGGGPDQLVVGREWGVLPRAGLALATAGLIAMTFRDHSVFPMAAMVGAVFIASLLDWARSMINVVMSAIRAWRNYFGGQPMRAARRRSGSPITGGWRRFEAVL